MTVPKVLEKMVDVGRDCVRFVKRQTARGMRRAAKKDPENAPIKVRYRGWIW